MTIADEFMIIEALDEMLKKNPGYENSKLTFVVQIDSGSIRVEETTLSEHELFSR